MKSFCLFRFGYLEFGAWIINSVIVGAISLWEMFFTISYRHRRSLILRTCYHIKRTFISFVLEHSMAGGGADLSIAEVTTLTSTYLRHCPHQFMYVGIILLIVKAVVTGHMLDLNGLRG